MARREKEIRIMVSTEEYALIQAKAKEANIQVAPYIRRVAQNPTIVNYSYTEISNHTREIAQIRNSINRLIFTIEAQNFFLPKEITTIVNLMQAIFQSENRLLRQVRTRQDKLEEKLCDRSLGSTISGGYFARSFTIVGLSMMCYTLGKEKRTCLGDFQLSGLIGKLLY